MHICNFDATVMQTLISEDVGIPELREFAEYVPIWERKHPLRALKLFIRALFSR